MKLLVLDLIGQWCYIVSADGIKKNVIIWPLMAFIRMRLAILTNLSKSKDGLSSKYVKYAVKKLCW